MRLQEVVDILAHYEGLLQTACNKVGKDIDTLQVHIGGDQLTRERFSSAKCLRSEHVIASEKFKHLTPITSELFHLLMNFLNMCFKELYRSDSSQDPGTLKYFQDRLNRKSVKTDVPNAYDADRDFFLSITRAYVGEALCQYFDMSCLLDTPKKHQIGNDATKEQKIEWFQHHFGNIVKIFVLPQPTTLNVEGR
jgi:hypothetical protein